MLTDVKTTLKSHLESNFNLRVTMFLTFLLTASDSNILLPLAFKQHRFSGGFFSGKLLE